MHRTRSVAVLVLAVAALLAAACGPRPTGEIAATVDLREARFVIGGGPTDELKLLCQLTVAAVEAAGAGASDQCARYGALDVRLPAERSFVDTGWGYLSRPDRDLDGRPDPPTTWEDLARADAARGLTWFPPTRFSDADAVVVSGATAAAGVRTLSDLARRPGTLCAPPGTDVARLLAGPIAADRPALAVRTADPGAVLAGVARGECTAGVVPGLSGRIPALGLVALADDRDALPRGGMAPVVRSDVAARHPGLSTVFAALTSRLDDETMRALNRQVGQEGRDARDVARAWLRDQGLTAP